MTDEASTVLAEARTDPVVRSGMAAARLSSMVGALIETVQDASDMRKGQIAEAMGVSAGRVSQIISGDGNVRIATLGRFLDACGYELELIARPKSGDGRVITLPRRRRSRGNGRQRDPEAITRESAGFHWLGVEGRAEVGDLASATFPPDRAAGGSARTVRQRR